MKVFLAALAACVVACLVPTVALADANPGNNGHHYHYGWIHKKSHSPAPTPGPTPGPNGGTTVGNNGAPNAGHNTGAGAGNGSGADATTAPQDTLAQAPVVSGIQPPAPLTTTAQSLRSLPNVWLVAILLASAIAAGVALGTWGAGRGGHVVLRRALDPVGIRI